MSDSEESGIGYRKTHLISPTSAWILTAPVGRVWRLTHFYSVALLLEKWFACHHSTPYFFMLLFPTAFYDRSRMTGRYLIPLKNRTHLCRILTAPVGRGWRLTHFYSVAPLLEKWFACHHSTPYFFIIIFPTAFYDRSRMTGRYLNAILSCRHS